LTKPRAALLIAQLLLAAFFLVQGARTRETFFWVGLGIVVLAVVEGAVWIRLRSRAK
jgi:hypothetical protein